MRDGHVIEILESGPFDRLTGAEWDAVRAHAARCDSCGRAFDAARVSSLLLRERAAESVEPPPFFETRVLAALRERQSERQQAWALPRLWKTAGALFASMVATVAALGALTFLAPGESSQADASDEAAAAEVFSADESILAQGGEEEMTYDQVLSVVYEPEASGAR